MNGGRVLKRPPFACLGCGALALERGEPFERIGERPRARPAEPSQGFHVAGEHRAVPLDARQRTSDRPHEATSEPVHAPVLIDPHGPGIADAHHDASRKP